MPKFKRRDEYEGGGPQIRCYHIFNGQVLNQLNQPAVSASKEGWVNYGRNNLYPNQMVNLMNSPTHNACVLTKKKMVVGNGLEYDATNREMAAWMAANDFEEVFRNIVFDYIIYDGFCINITWSKGRSFIDKAQYIDYKNVRASNFDAMGDVGDYWFCKDWAQWKKVGTIRIKSFDPKAWSAPVQLMDFHVRNSFNDFYGVPEYIGSIDSIETEIHINDFHKNNIEQGFFPSVLINHKYKPTDLELKSIDEQIKASFGGSKAAGQIINLFPANDSVSPEITILNPNQNDKLFMVLDDRIKEKILLGHGGINPILLGIATPGKLGDQKELINAYKYFYSKWVRDTQATILREINRIFMINFGTTVHITNSVYIEDAVTDIVLKQVLTQDEYVRYYRDKLNLLTDDGVLAEVKPNLLSAADFIKTTPGA